LLGMPVARRAEEAAMGGNPADDVGPSAVAPAPTDIVVCA